MNSETFFFKLAAVALLILLGFFILLGSWYTVPEGFRGIILRNNAAVGVANPGFGLKIPFIDDVVDMSVQTERVDVENVSAYSRDVQQSTSSIAVNYRLSTNAVLDVYSELGMSYAHKVLEPSVMRRYKEAFGQYTAAEVVMKRDMLANQVSDLIKADMVKFGIEVETIQVRNIDFSESYEKSIEAAASAEADVKKEKQLLEQVRVSAQKQIAEAEAAAKAVKLTADAEAYKVRTEGEAQATAIKARGDALRENPNLVQLIAAEKWNGALPSHQIPNASIPFISIPQH